MRLLAVRLSAYYTLIFMGLGSLFSFIGIYYSHIGLRHDQIGYIGSAEALVALLLQPLWGMAGDRTASKNRVLALCLAVSALAVWLIPLAQHQFWLLLSSTLLFHAFLCAIHPLSDTIVLEVTDSRNISFGLVRTSGTVGYIAVSVAAAWIISSNMTFIFILYSVFMLLALASFCGMPTISGHQSASGRRAPFTALFRDRKLVALYVYTLVIQTTVGFFLTFHPVYSLEKGVGTGMIGLCIAIGAVAEFPFMLIFDRLYRRFGIIRLLLISGGIHALRWLLYATVFGPSTAIAIWLLHGGTYIVFYLCLAVYVNEHVEDELKASGQMMNAVVTLGLSKIIGSLAGGLASSTWGPELTFGGASLLCLAAMAALWFWSRRAEGAGERADCGKGISR